MKAIFSIETLFMSASNRRAILITRAGKKMRRRALNFADEHAALDWCLKRHAAFILLPGESKNYLN